MKTTILVSLILAIAFFAGCAEKQQAHIRTYYDEKAMLAFLGEPECATLLLSCESMVDYKAELEEFGQTIFNDPESATHHFMDIVNIIPGLEVLRYYDNDKRKWSGMDSAYTSKELKLNPACKQIQVTYSFHISRKINELIGKLGQPDSKQPGILSRLLIDDNDRINFSVNPINIEWYQYGRLNFGISTDPESKGSIIALTLVHRGTHDPSPKKNVVIY
jgi:hypothetical protein